MEKYLAEAKDKGFKTETIGFSDTADVKLRVTQGTPDIQFIEIIRGKLIYVFQTHLIGAFQAQILEWHCLLVKNLGLSSKIWRILVTL